jgi:hypothetical protein
MLMMKKSFTAVIGIGALTFLVALGFFPGLFASGMGPNQMVTPAGCTVTWTNPSGTYNPGQTVAAYVSTSCEGAGSWTITSQPGGQEVASGSFTCGSSGCSVVQLWSYTAGSAPLVAGSYQYSAQFNGASKSYSFTVSGFIVTPQFPAGVVLAVLAPIAALVGYAKFRKPAL